MKRMFCLGCKMLPSLSFQYPYVSRVGGGVYDIIWDDLVCIICSSFPLTPSGHKGHLSAGQGLGCNGSRDSQPASKGTPWTSEDRLRKCIGDLLESEQQHLKASQKGDPLHAPPFVWHYTVFFWHVSRWKY